MNLSDLVSRIHRRNGELSREQVDRAVQSLVSAMASTLERHGRVEIRDFGVFHLSRRAPRELRNPRSSEKVHVATRLVPRFKAGKRLREKVNAGNSGAA